MYDAIEISNLDKVLVVVYFLFVFGLRLRLTL